MTMYDGGYDKRDSEMSVVAKKVYDGLKRYKERRGLPIDEKELLKAAKDADERLAEARASNAAAERERELDHKREMAMLDYRDKYGEDSFFMKNNGAISMAILGAKDGDDLSRIISLTPRALMSDVRSKG